MLHLEFMHLTSLAKDHGRHMIWTWRRRRRACDNFLKRRM